jgi:quercetin dioxygenase-like cupin family protein
MRRSVLLSPHRMMMAASALISAAVTYGLTLMIGPPSAQVVTEPTGRAVLLTQALADIPGREVRVLSIDLAPGDGSVPHRHPGHHVFGYLVEGSYEWRINQEPAKTFKSGDVFYEPPGVLHAISRNASTTSRAKLLVFMVADAAKPSTVNEPGN